MLDGWSGGEEMKKFVGLLFLLLVSATAFAQTTTQAALRERLEKYLEQYQVPNQAGLLQRLERLLERHSAEYLGRYSVNKYDPDSISNPYGAYGNPYSPSSVKNRFGPYGNPFSHYSVNNPYAIATPRLFGHDGKYLGKFSANPYDPESISNPYGRFGNPYSPESVNNPYGIYGSRYSPLSPNNPYSTQGPVILHHNPFSFRHRNR